MWSQNKKPVELIEGINEQVSDEARRIQEDTNNNLNFKLSNVSEFSNHQPTHGRSFKRL